MIQTWQLKITTRKNIQNVSLQKIQYCLFIEPKRVKKMNYKYKNFCFH